MKLHTKYPLPVKLDRDDLDELDALLRRLLSEGERPVRITYTSSRATQIVSADDIKEFARSERLKDVIPELKIEATNGLRDIVITYDSGGTIEALDAQQNILWEKDASKEVLDFFNRRKHPYVYFMLFLIVVVVSSGLLVLLMEKLGGNVRLYKVASVVNFVFSLVLLTAVRLHQKGKVFPFADINLGKSGTRTYAEKVATASFIVSLVSLIILFINSVLRG